MTQSKFTILFYIWLLPAFIVAQTPYAEIVNTSADICESVNITLSIRFSGTAPFGIRYKIGGTTFIINGDGTNIINIDKLSDDMVWESPATINLEIPAGQASISQTIEILEVYDQNSTASPPWAAGEGTEITDQSIIYTSFRRPQPNAGNDIDSCGLSAILDASPDPISDTFYWQDPAQGTFSDTRDANASFTAATQGTYPLVLLQDNGACQVRDTVSVVLKGSPSGTIATASEVCGTSSQNATLDFQFTGNGPWNYNFSDGTNNFNYTTTASTTAETLAVTGETTFGLNWIKDDNGCYAASSQMTGSANVIDLKPTPNAGADQAICALETTLEALTTSYNGTWSAPAGITFTNPADPETQVISTLYGRQPLVWTEMNKTCPASDTVEVRFDQMPTPVDAGEDMKLYHQYSTQLNALPPIAGTGLWSITSGAGQLNNPERPAAGISGMEMGVTRLLWSVSNGVCPTLTDELTIIIEGLTYHTGFSPNGDSFNNTFIIQGAAEIPNNELMVLNRHGKVVFRKSGFGNEGWDGTDLSGRPLSDGIYYFVFKGDRIDPIKDYLVIKTR